MPACCFADRAEVKAEPLDLEKKARHCGGQRFREEAL
jgi:hypothetical protein